MSARPDIPVNKGQFGFLLIGAGRGGTSLPMALLDAHSQLEVGFETGAIDNLMGLGIDHGLSQTENRERLVFQRGEHFLQKCQSEASKFPRRFWGNKITTEQLYGLEDHNLINPPVDINDVFFRKVLGFDIKVIFILRDGRSTIRSKITRTGQTPEHAAVRWKYAIKVWRYLRNNHPNFMTIKYEELLSGPERELTRICSFLGIEYEPAMLEGSDNDKILPEYRQDQINTQKNKLGNYPRICLPLIAEELYEAGYIGRIKHRLLRIFNQLLAG